MIPSIIDDIIKNNGKINLTQFKPRQTVYNTLNSLLKSINKFLGPYKILEPLQNNKAKIKNQKPLKKEIIHLKS